MLCFWRVFFFLYLIRKNTIKIVDNVAKIIFLLFALYLRETFLKFYVNLDFSYFYEKHFNFVTRYFMPTANRKYR